MKVERISENQLKLTLTKEDLKEREITLEDLITPSEKTQSLFRDLMEQVLDEYDFITENTPLMVEAVPSGMDGLMLIITKVTNKDKTPQKSAELFSQAHELHRWKKKPLDTMEQTEDKHSDLLIYSFPQLDDVIQVSVRLEDNFKGESAIYKNDGKYFLILQQDAYHTEESAEDLELILQEYGHKHVSTPLAKYYLLEHGQTILEEKAVKALAKTFG